jgi:hypothetical protein
MEYQSRKVPNAIRILGLMALLAVSTIAGARYARVHHHPKLFTETPSCSEQGCWKCFEIPMDQVHFRAHGRRFFR